MNAIKKLLSVFILVAIATIAAFYYWAHRPLKLSQPTLELTVEPHSSLRYIAGQFNNNGLPINPVLFEILARALKLSAHIKAGSYTFSSGMTPFQVLKKLAAGDVTYYAVRVIEGWTFAQMRLEMDKQVDIRHDTAGLTNSDILKKIGARETHAEGLFFPDTYLFPKNVSDIDIYKRAYQAAKENLNNAWEMRAPNLPYKTPYDALIMASIVEKETGQSGERAMIAGVFINRLKKAMPLQTDPTVIYGLTEPLADRLRRRHLITDSAYNTYTRIGLPPTPIALPGMASLIAAMHPAQTQALYFVARGDGTSQFSNSLAEHNVAVNKYQRGISVKNSN